MKLIPSNRICSECDSKTTYYNKRTKRHHWHTDNGRWLCHKCYLKYINNPQHPIRHTKESNARKIRFKEKRLSLDENPRKGSCKQCGKKIGDEYINCKGMLKIVDITDMHHIEYCDDDPLKNTEELCKQCHGRISSLSYWNNINK